MAFTPEVIIGIIGTIIGISSLIMSWFFTRKALEQADRNLKTQLLYEDKKQALKKLQEIITGSKYFELHEKIDLFLLSFEGNYVPYDVGKEIHNMLIELEKFENNNAYYTTIGEIREDTLAQDYEPPKEGMTYQEEFDRDFEWEIKSFKRIAKERLNKSLLKID